MEKVYNKLIRDRIPQIIEEQGNRAVTRKLNGQEYLTYLNKKLKEEVDEYLEADEEGTVDESIEELADILEVMQAISLAKYVPIERLEEMRKEKAAARGTFSKMLVLEKVILDN